MNIELKKNKKKIKIILYFEFSIDIGKSDISGSRNR